MSYRSDLENRIRAMDRRLSILSPDEDLFWDVMEDRRSLEFELRWLDHQTSRNPSDPIITRDLGRDA